MSAAEAVFNQIINGGWPEIEAQVRERRSETLHLDFKRKVSTSTSLLERDDRKNLSVALSGFANADGGVLLWGIDARRQGDHDCAVAINALDQAAEFVAELIGATPELVSPYVNGTRHEVVRSERGGVVVTFIPASDSAPHMATGPALHRYYRRSGSSFRQLEHYEIADLFGRRPHPRLTAASEWEVAMSRYSAGHSGVARFAVRIVIKNEGKGLARFPTLSLRELAGWDLTPIRGGVSHLPQIPPPRGWSHRWAGGADVVVYPDDELVVASLTTEIRSDQTEYPDLRITYRVQADSTAPTDGELSIAGDEIRRATIDEFERVNIPYYGKSVYGPRVTG